MATNPRASKTPMNLAFCRKSCRTVVLRRIKYSLRSLLSLRPPLDNICHLADAFIRRDLRASIFLLRLIVLGPVLSIYTYRRVESILGVVLMLPGSVEFQSCLQPISLPPHVWHDLQGCTYVFFVCFPSPPAVRHKRQMTSLCFLVTDNHTRLFAYTELSDMSDLLHSKQANYVIRRLRRL